VHSLSDVFSFNANGTIDESGFNTAGIMCGSTLCTNAYVAANYDIYFLGTLNAGVGVHLGAGSITDLSGVSIRDPRAVEPGQKHFVTGEIFAGGTLKSQSAYQFTTPLFADTLGFRIYGATNLTFIRVSTILGQRLRKHCRTRVLR
jgi:hypothetical protein